MVRIKGVKGFTIIELMVVIVILGILAAVVAPRIPLFIVSSRMEKAAAEHNMTKEEYKKFRKWGRKNHYTYKLSSLQYNEIYQLYMKHKDEPVKPGKIVQEVDITNEDGSVPFEVLNVSVNSDNVLVIETKDKDGTNIRTYDIENTQRIYDVLDLKFKPAEKKSWYNIKE